MNKWHISILTSTPVIDSQYQPTLGKNPQKWQTIYDGIKDDGKEIYNLKKLNNNNSR